MSYKRNKQAEESAKLLRLHFGDILEELPELKKYMDKMQEDQNDFLASDDLINIEIILKHIRDHCNEGLKITKSHMEDIGPEDK